MERKEQRWTIVLAAALFFFKRFAFIVIILVLKDYLWFQIMAINCLTLGTVIFTLWYWPLETKQANLFEVFNDVALLLMTYHMWCFTDIVPEPETRHMLGFSFIAVSMMNILVHLVTMLLESGIKMRQTCRKCFIKKQKMHPDGANASKETRE